jgi:hypothetical protein
MGQALHKLSTSSTFNIRATAAAKAVSRFPPFVSLVSIIVQFFVEILGYQNSKEYAAKAVAIPSER